MISQIQSFLRALWAFIKNHKKKFTFLAVLIALGFGGFYFAKRALLQKLAEVGELGKKMEQRRRKELELARLRPECTATVMSFLVPVRRQLVRLTDVVPITTKLRELRAKQKASRKPPTEEEMEEINALWEDLKVNSLARLLCGVYALTLLDLLLLVQLHVASKRCLEPSSSSVVGATATTTPPTTPTTATTPPTPTTTTTVEEELAVTKEVRQEFMFKSTEFLVNTGLAKLLNTCMVQIRNNTKPWLMGTDAVVTREEILSRLNQTRAAIEGQTPTWFLSSLVVDETVFTSATGELKALLNETYDLLESPHFASVLSQTLDHLFQVLFEDLFQAKQFEGQERDNEMTYVLAKVIVGIKLFAKHVLATSESGDHDGDDEQPIVVPPQPTGELLVPPGTEGSDAAAAAVSNRYIKRLEEMPCLEEFARAILGLGGSEEGMEGLEGLDFLGDSMKEIMPLLQQLGGEGGKGGGAPDLASLLPLLQGGGNGVGQQPLGGKN